VTLTSVYVYLYVYVCAVCAHAHVRAPHLSALVLKLRRVQGAEQCWDGSSPPPFHPLLTLLSQAIHLTLPPPTPHPAPQWTS
jgi:hypothetical protein